MRRGVNTPDKSSCLHCKICTFLLNSFWRGIKPFATAGMYWAPKFVDSKDTRFKQSFIKCRSPTVKLSVVSKLQLLVYFQPQLVSGNTMNGNMERKHPIRPSQPTVESQTDSSKQLRRELIWLGRNGGSSKCMGGVLWQADGTRHLSVPAVQANVTHWRGGNNNIY